MIIDTAGRLHVDADMMKQARKIRDTTKPQIVLMACDAMTGQDAVVQARAFMHEVDTTGFILTKLDGDARGGAALSITAVTGRPGLLRRHRREARGPRALLPRPDGEPDPRDGRRAHADRQGERDDGHRGRPRVGRADAEGAVHVRGLPDAAARDAEARADPGPAEDAARRARGARTRSRISPGRSTTASSGGPRP